MSVDVDRTLWVGNLSEKVTDELLYELFLQAGPLEKVSIAKERDGRLKGFAFITFQHNASVPYTIQLFEGSQLHGRPLKLQCRPGSIHQQQQQQQQQLMMNMRNPYQQSSPIPQNPYMNPNMPMMRINSRPQNPYIGNQSPIPPQPNFQRSHTWHGGEMNSLSDNEQSGTRDGRDGSRDRDNGSSRERHTDRGRHRHTDRDRDNSGRDRSGSRNWNEDYRGSQSPSSYRDGYDNSGHDLQAKRQRVLEKTDRLKESYHRGNRHQHGHDRKRGRY
ncbi:RBM7-like protein [Mya arenaria]|uniref:RBM7-like protein n=1 Tax=Mya arenaria TaxID=6604 RepID=A0ABY7ED50_MYAAR|nr:RNA-binding protein 7-like [Mya arenaria]WAR06646.1 RBM7-like protein [Mya arenaria]